MATFTKMWIAVLGLGLGWLPVIMALDITTTCTYAVCALDVKYEEFLLDAIGGIVLAVAGALLGSQLKPRKTA